MTAIQWTDRTWNPVRGCSRVSEGCRNCYAERIAARFSNEGFKGFATMSPPRWTGTVALVPEKLREPLSWRKPSRVFVNSMSDLFHEALSDSDIMRVFDVMYRAQQHTFQILTKRPRRMLAWFRDTGVERMGGLSHVWLGVSVEDQATADERIPLLLQTPAAVRFVSYEPALGPVDFTNMRLLGHTLDALRGEWCANETGCLVDDKGDGATGWLIVGGESGPGARPCNVEWLRSAVHQCQKAGVPVFVKQLGANCGDTPDRGEWIQGRSTTSAEECGYMGVRRLKDRKGGDPSEWPEDLRVREFPAYRCPAEEP